MKSISLITPEHSYSAKDEGNPFIYMPGSMLTIAAQIIKAGGQIANIIDANVQSIDDIGSNIVGISHVGAPDIPGGIKTIKHIQNYKPEVSFILGGQALKPYQSSLKVPIPGINDEEFTSLYQPYQISNNIYNGMRPQIVESILELPNTILDNTQISIIPAYELIPDEIMKQYLEREFCLFVSKGCVFECTYCAALKSTPEQYKNISILEQDIRYLIQRAQKLGINSLSWYISNLDLFQTPKAIEGFGKLLEQIQSQYPQFTIKRRGLATVKMGTNLFNKSPQIIELLQSTGLYMVGYGVDGLSSEVRKKTKKNHNNEAICYDIIKKMNQSGLQTELLMTVGHDGIETEQSLQILYEFAQAMIKEYNCISRPYMARNRTIGNDGRIDPKYQTSKGLLIEQPELFQALDYAGLANTLSHQYDSDEQIKINNYYYELLTLLTPGTQIIRPYHHDDTAIIRQNKIQYNKGKYDR